MAGSRVERSSQLFNAAVILLLVLVVTAGWCTAQSKWTFDAWTKPTQYLDPVYSDFIGEAAYFKSSNDESFYPFGWKHVSTLGAPDAEGWDRVLTPAEVLHCLLGFLCG